MKIRQLFYLLTFLTMIVFGDLSASAQKNYVWTGEWTVTSRYTPGTLKIKPVSAKKFSFKVESLSGANTGEISGFAAVKGNKAYFDDRLGAKKGVDIYGCILTFTNKGTSIRVSQNDKCQAYGGMNVSFEGEYLKGKQRKYTETFVERGVFTDLSDDRKLKLLTKTDYETLLDAFHQVYPEEDLDQLGAKVFTGCIEGICPWYAGIIMFDQKGNFWAAVLRAEDNQKPKVRYYTNAAAWTQKLPKTIENWAENLRSSNEGLTIVFKNKN
jgi:hypothetical protein